jgi:hypothetical protein
MKYNSQLTLIGIETGFATILGVVIAIATLTTPVVSATEPPSAATTSPQAKADPVQLAVASNKDESRNIDIAIALDVSNSMDGLLDSARQRIWDIVNQFGSLKPRPNLRVAVLTFGRDNYSSDDGWVQINQPLTSNLDAISESLFSFTTRGGTEYVARAVQRAVNGLDWSKESSALRIVVVAGNEPATQDPKISIEQAMKEAVAKGIVVNPIFCGSERDGMNTGWQKVATLTDGIYASIDQNQAAVASIATPMDGELARLNDELNRTYVAFGADGGAAHLNQAQQDLNAAKMSAPSLASRVVAKSSAIYKNDSWDLVDAVKSGKKIEEVKDADLPESLKGKSVAERKAFVNEQAKKRADLQSQIGKLAADRSSYIAAEKAKAAPSASKGLDSALSDGLRKQAEKKGFAF